MDTASKDHLLEEFTRERHVLEGYIFAIVRDPHLAEDVYQDTAVEVLKNLERYEAALPFRVWVKGIARNKAKQSLSKHARLTPTPNDRLAHLVETAYQEQEESTWDLLSHYHLYLRECMQRLSGTLRSMIQLRYYEGLSAKAVAEQLGKTAGAVDVALTRARQALFECIEKRQALAEPNRGASV